MDAFGITYGQEKVLGIRDVTPEDLADPNFKPSAIFHIQFGRELTDAEHDAITKALAEPGSLKFKDANRKLKPLLGGNSRVPRPNAQGAAAHELLMASNYLPMTTETGQKTPYEEFQETLRRAREVFRKQGNLLEGPTFLEMHLRDHSGSTLIPPYKESSATQETTGLEPAVTDHPAQGTTEEAEGR